MKPTLTSLALAVWMAASAIGAEQWAVFETSFTSAKKYENPFIEVEVDVVFEQGERQWKVPAFWAGGGKWSVRFAPPTQGECTFYFDPATGRRFDQGTVVYAGPTVPPFESRLPGVIGTDEYHAPDLPSPQDWVLVLERLKP